MNNETLAARLDSFMIEMKQAHAVLAESQQVLGERINNIDLNGSAQVLRQFGKWLAEHPDFMQREAAEENRRMQRDIAIGWLTDTLHLRDLRRKMIWVLSAVFTGALLALGTDLYSLKPGVTHIINLLSHATP